MAMGAIGRCEDRRSTGACWVCPVGGCYRVNTAISATTAPAPAPGQRGFVRTEYVPTFVETGLDRPGVTILTVDIGVNRPAGDIEHDGGRHPHAERSMAAKRPASRTTGMISTADLVNPGD